MITKEELHRLIDECDIVKLNSAKYARDFEYIDLELYEFVEHLKYCKAKAE